MKKVHYAVILQSQLGPRSGEIFLQEDRGVVSGHFALLGVRNGFQAVCWNRENISYRDLCVPGRFRSPMMPS